MESIVPDSLRDEQNAVEQAIRDAFRSVNRDGGVSWSEAAAIDSFESDQQRAGARLQDKECRWEDLVDDPNWIEGPGIGGFNFLDEIGFAYYIAPAMIRCTRRGYGEFIGYALEIDGSFKQSLIRRINEGQARAIARFVRFMIATHEAVNDDIDGEVWRHAYELYWRRFE